MTRLRIPALATVFLMAAPAIAYAAGSGQSPQHDTPENKATSVAPQVPPSQGGEPVSPQAMKPEPARSLDEQQLRAKLEQQGYKQVGPLHQIADGKAYEAQAFKGDQKVTLLIDPQTGTITEQMAQSDVDRAIRSGSSTPQGPGATGTTK